ncbi:MAG: Head fiber protein [Candidatus Paraimprobicoccus trichonymphae]|uniref:Head fiber protein n=1 Tax=Candidatus Paraimprobicoccus trichonymphae TaxID=3033793 RepID=A0AA48HX09_9FIRM|nr:MAG: Head fiber protein [Candidatus Paraimprobicoccus trichonymphae]
MSYNTKNYHAQNGDWVVGGKVRIENGGIVEGMPQIANQPNTTTENLVADFNTLLTNLKTAGYMVADSSGS